MGEQAVYKQRGWNDRLRPLGWPALGVALCTLVFAVLPGEQVRLGARQLNGLVGTYLYANPMILPPPADVRVTQIFLPKTVRVEWNAGVADPGFGISYTVMRVDPATETVLASINTADQFWMDSFDFTYGTTYEYRVFAWPDDNSNSSLPPPPPGADPNDVTTYWLASDISSVQMVPAYTVATDNQTVDGRLDLRYGNPTLLDFKFGSRTYRGGLFTGYAADPSKVGRSFLRFELPELPSGASFWAGSVNAYHTVSWTDGTTEIGCQEVADVTWDEDTLKWSIAPHAHAGRRHRALRRGVRLRGAGRVHGLGALEPQCGVGDGDYRERADLLRPGQHRREHQPLGLLREERIRRGESPRCALRL